MKKINREKTKEITKTILEILVVSGFATLVGMLSQGRTADKLFKCLIVYSDQRIRETIKRLKFQGMIEYDEEDEQSPIVLTAKGMKRAIRNRLFRSFRRQKRWDHFWRMVLFDVPEKTGKRRAFQLVLKRSGLYRLQDSVYLSPFDIREDIDKYVRSHGIVSSVIVATTSSLGSHEKDARRYFLNIGQKL